MFFLKKLLQFIEKKGFRADGKGADRHPAGLGCVLPASGSAVGHAVRRESAAGESRAFPRGERPEQENFCRGGDEERYAWYFAVRGFFARSAQNKAAGGVGIGRRAAGGREKPFRAAAPAGNSARFSRGERTVGDPALAFPERESFGAEERAQAFACGDVQEDCFDEFFAPLASLRGLNVEERRRGGF